MSKNSKRPFRRALKKFRAGMRELSAERAAKATPRESESPPATARFLTVPFDERFKVKRVGARWDALSKRWWFDPSRQSETEFLPWLCPVDGDGRSATREWHRAKRNRSKNR
ncbi:DUF5710 domain-containing protein [Luteibacter sp. NPDC031894]|uniref:DUF5710 domain-containing protein n=1 Tax=Luteibacter sp. NPDC031894 TaxID=3390572 RepID=UPI003D069F91